MNACSMRAVAALAGLLGATPATAFSFLVNRGLDTCAGTPMAAATDAGRRRVPIGSGFADERPAVSDLPLPPARGLWCHRLGGSPLSRRL